MIKYLEECGYQNTDYLHYPAEEINKILVKFWFAIRKKKKSSDSQDSNPADCSTDNDKDMYSKATLENIKHALNRNLQNADHQIDLMNDNAFIKAQKAYHDACRELKAKGKAVVKSYPEIVHSGNLTSIHKQNTKICNQ